MPRRETEKKTHSAEVAFLAANSFRSLSHGFISKIIRKDKDTAGQIAMADLGGLISSATTLALAIELYLKSLRTIVGISVPQTHHLWNLYKDLPDAFREVIESNYERFPSLDGKETVCIDATIGLDTIEGELSERLRQHPSASSDISLKGVLNRSSDAFESWRYFHEQGENPTVVTYDFRRLDFIAYLLKESAQRLIRDHSLGRIRIVQGDRQQENRDAIRTQ